MGLDVVESSPIKLEKECLCRSQIRISIWGKWKQLNYFMEYELVKIITSWRLNSVITSTIDMKRIVFIN